MNCIHLGTLFSQVLNDNECNNNSLINTDDEVFTDF